MDLNRLPQNLLDPLHSQPWNAFQSNLAWPPRDTRAIKPGGCNGLRSIVPGGIQSDRWRQLIARAAIWQAWQRTDQSHVRNNNVFVDCGDYISPRQLSQYRSVGDCVNSETIANRKARAKNSYFSNDSSQCFVADVFSTPRSGPPNLFDRLVSPQFRAADRIAHRRDA